MAKTNIVGLHYRVFQQLAENVLEIFYRYNNSNFLLLKHYNGGQVRKGQKIIINCLCTIWSNGTSFRSWCGNS